MSKIRSYILGVKLRLKDGFIENYLETQDKRWVRIIDALSAIFCFISAVIALYLLQTQPGGKLSNISNFVVWGYLITSLPLAVVLYKESSLKKLERHAMVFFILFSSMSLLITIMLNYTKA